MKLGFGIGLIPVAPSVPPDPELHERPMGRYFGNLTANVVRRRSGYCSAAGEEFLRLVRTELNPGPGRRG